MAMTATATHTMSRLISSPKPLSLLSPKTLRPILLLSSSSSNLSLLPLNLRHRLPKSLRFSSNTALKVTATISVGDKLPESTFSYFDTDDELQTTTVSDLTVAKKSIIFAVPGAFTPTCTQKHLPGFVEKAAELKSKGVDAIACVSVNDAFVMKAWKKELGIGDEVMLLSDGNGTFTKAIGCELDLSDKPVGLGVRSRRYAMLVDDGVVKVLNLEEGGAFTFSGAEDMLKAL
ncbi:peroxiredoxin-2E-1, chloroplastic-like [Actinidia eriantha]|uniref:peroxiredoxin-2E-1, chloroplastic-like n=1 Tax=Actinidia eriantha TaxID=165200 RepID=UPI002588279A|nr:peroxiredoxin-2E-1, chloroplastic-like [Actinidia eriantha]